MKFYLSLILFSGCIPLLAEPVCHKCELNRAYNKEHPGDYEYYEDYLKTQKKDQESTKGSQER